MTGKKATILTFILFALIWITGAARNGYGGSLPESQLRVKGDWLVSTSRAETYSSDHGRRAGKLKMIELCRRLEDDLTRDRETRDKEVEVYRETTEPGATEYRQEIQESSRFATPEDEQRTLELCSQLEYSAAPVPDDKSMVALCRQLQRTADHTSIHTRSELEEYKTETNSGDEYSRHYRESSRYSQTAKDRDEMLVLCAELGYPLR
jgi:hypothetical protein